MTGEGAQARNNRAFHRGQIVAKPDRVDEFSSPLVILGIECVDMANPAAHKEENNRLGLRDVVWANANGLDLPRLGQNPAERQPQEPAANLVDKISPREASAGIDF